MKIFYTPNGLVGGRQHFWDSFLWQFALLRCLPLCFISFCFMISFWAIFLLGFFLFRFSCKQSNGYARSQLCFICALLMGKSAMGVEFEDYWWKYRAAKCDHMLSYIVISFDIITKSAFFNLCSTFILAYFVESLSRESNLKIINGTFRTGGTLETTKYSHMLSYSVSNWHILL